MIKYLYSIFLLSLLVGFSEQKVNVTVLYEALCPDSAVFIKNQLAGCYDAIKDCIDLELVPYGHANHTQVGGQWRFECQHKERECSLNTHHACGIKYAPSQGAQVKFVSCMMEKAYVYLNDEDVTIACTAEAGINFNLVKRCYTTTEGQELSVHHGERTITFGYWLNESEFINYHTDYIEKLTVHMFYYKIRVNDGFGVSKVAADKERGKPPEKYEDMELQAILHEDDS
ncbi:hypothetical protein Trydic_g21722 [Trypoxylus dichotomus]